jgi:hypothetical protein
MEKWIKPKLSESGNNEPCASVSKSETIGSIDCNEDETTVRVNAAAIDGSVGLHLAFTWICTVRRSFLLLIYDTNCCVVFTERHVSAAACVGNDASWRECTK